MTIDSLVNGVDDVFVERLANDVFLVRRHQLQYKRPIVFFLLNLMLLLFYLLIHLNHLLKSNENNKTVKAMT